MKKAIVLYLMLLCSLCAMAQKCLVIFGVNEDVTVNPIENPRFTMLYNDSVLVKFQQLEQQGENTYRLEFDYRAGKYTIHVEADGHEAAEKDFTVSTRRNTMSASAPSSCPRSAT